MTLDRLRFPFGFVQKKLNYNRDPKQIDPRLIINIINMVIQKHTDIISSYFVNPSNFNPNFYLFQRGALNLAVCDVTTTTL